MCMFLTSRRCDDIVAYGKNHGFEKITFKDLTLYHSVQDQNISQVLKGHWTSVTFIFLYLLL